MWLALADNQHFGMIRTMEGALMPSADWKLVNSEVGEVKLPKWVGDLPSFRKWIGREGADVRLVRMLDKRGRPRFTMDIRER